MSIRAILICASAAVMSLNGLAICADSNRPSHVSDLATTGFTLQISTHIAAPPEKVYAALLEPGSWWGSDHTYSGNASNLHLDARAGGCWCETLPNGGFVQHLTVVYADPGKALRLRGALGPFQALGVDGALTWSLKPAAAGTDLSMTYKVGGYNKEGFAQLSQATDEVLTEQLDRLKKSIEPRAPQGR
jgi:uncharacterized protein YndB with AHSA1/START domain